MEEVTLVVGLKEEEDFDSGAEEGEWKPLREEDFGMVAKRKMIGSS